MSAFHGLLHSTPGGAEKADQQTATCRAWIVAHALGEPAEVWLWRQVTGLRRVRPLVVCWAYKNRDVYPVDEDAVTIVPFASRPTEGRRRWLHRLRGLPRMNFYGSVGREFKHLVDLAAHHRPQVMLCHFGSAALRLLPVAEKLGIPLVAHFHGQDVSSSLRNRWYRWSIIPALSRFAAVVVVGSHQRQWMLRHGVPEERVHLIPCGVPTEQFRPAGAQRTDGVVQFVAVSRLVAWKGVDYTLRAFAAVHAAVPQARLAIVGDGPDRRALEGLARELQVAPAVRFTGVLAPEQVRKELAGADVFVQHSLTYTSGWCEGFGVSIAEAAAMGLPLVVTRSGGIPDQVIHGETGFLCPERDVEAMAEAMRMLACDSALRKEMGAAARRRVVEHFDAAGQIHKLEQVLLTTTGGGRVRPWSVRSAVWNGRPVGRGETAVEYHSKCKS